MQNEVLLLTEIQNNLRMWHIIVGLLVITGTVLLSLKPMLQNILGLSDSQIIHPGIADEIIYNKWNKYKKITYFYDKYRFFYLGLFLIMLAPVIEILLNMFK